MANDKKRGIEIAASILAGKESLRTRLHTLDLSAVGISEYNYTYFNNKLPYLEYWLELYGTLLFRALSDIEKDLSDAFPVKIILVETFLALAFPALPSTFPHPTSFVLLVLLANVYVLQV